MAANTAPIFTATPKSWILNAIATANTTTDLTSGTIYLLATAGANGARFDRIFLQPLGTNTASVARFWINNGSTTGTAANNSWFLDVSLPAATNSVVASIPAVIVELNLVVEAAFRLYLTLGTTVAAGLDSLVAGGNY